MAAERRSPREAEDPGDRTPPHDPVGASIESMGHDIEAATAELDAVIAAARERERRLSSASPPPADDAS